MKTRTEVSKLIHLVLQPYSFATFATTNSFHFTNKNQGFNFVKSPQLALPAYKSIHDGTVNSISTAPISDLSTTVELKANNEKKSVDENTLNEVKTVAEEIIKSEVVQPDSLSTQVNNEFENSNNPFKRPPTIHKVTYSVPVNQPSYADPIGKYIYQTHQQGLTSLAVVLPSKTPAEVETKIESAPQAGTPEIVGVNENQPTDRIDKNDEFQFHREVVSKQIEQTEVKPETPKLDQAPQQPPTTNENNSNAPSIDSHLEPQIDERKDPNVNELPTFFFPAQRPPVGFPNQASLEPNQQPFNDANSAINIPQPNSPQGPLIDSRQDSNIEQPESFFFAPRRQQYSGPPNYPSLQLPVPQNNRFALPPSSSQSNPGFPQSQTPTQTPQFFSGGNFNVNRFAVPSTQPTNPQAGNQQPGPPGPPPPGFPFPRNLFPGGGPPPPGQEPENGYNPFHQYEQFPEPPYESEFVNEPPLQDAPQTNSQRSAGENPPLPPMDFAQSTLRNVRTEELIDVTQRKQLSPGCAYNTISYGPDGEDCIQARKRRQN
ncbi:unnamed protein product [Orchesella dallaii]|uniref:Uncharacterized protein n=1 Tax=Orchesella dallaii TaxID=48710 RepID=A0ABP1QGQ7_9HEXA